MADGKAYLVEVDIIIIPMIQKSTIVFPLPLDMFKVFEKQQNKNQGDDE